MTLPTIKTRKQTAISLLILIVAGIASKFYAGPGAGWVQNSLGGIIYVVFWSLGLILFRPDWQAGKITLFIFSLTSAIEFTQLIRTPWLDDLRMYPLIRWLIGNRFNPSDFVYYLIGAVLSFLWIRSTKAKEE